MKRIFALIPALSLAACATVTAEHEQTIIVLTTPPGATCVVKNDVGQWEIKETPGAATVTRSFNPLGIACSHPQAGRGTTVIEAKTRGRAYGNLLMLGVPAIVDAYTGAGYEYEPAEVNIMLNNPKP